MKKKLQIILLKIMKNCGEVREKCAKIEESCFISLCKQAAIVKWQNVPQSLRPSAVNNVKQ